MAGVAIAGNPGAKLQKVEPYFDPATGWGRRETWAGPKAAIDAKAAEIGLAGIKFTTSQKGPHKALVCDIPGVPDGGQTGEDIADTYEFVAEWAQESIFANPKVIAAAGTAETLVNWRYQIEKALSAKPPTALSGSPAAMLQALYWLRARGVESFELRRIVFRRTRTLPVNHPSTVKMDFLEDIWTTAQLISDFDIPQEIADQFPANPAITPVGTIWGWKYRQDSSQILYGIGGKKTEIKEWMFAAWPVDLYDV